MFQSPPLSALNYKPTSLRQSSDLILSAIVNGCCTWSNSQLAKRKTLTKVHLCLHGIPCAALRVCIIYGTYIVLVYHYYIIVNTFAAF